MERQREGTKKEEEEEEDGEHLTLGGSSFPAQPSRYKHTHTHITHCMLAQTDSYKHTHSDSHAYSNTHTPAHIYIPTKMHIMHRLVHFQANTFEHTHSHTYTKATH